MPGQKAPTKRTAKKLADADAEILRAAKQAAGGQKALKGEMEIAARQAADELELKREKFRKQELEHEIKLRLVISEKEILTSRTIEDQRIISHRE